MSLDLKKLIIALLLDLSKAFDTVDYKLILEKLAYYNFSFEQCELNTKLSYLSNLFNKVKYQNCTSDRKPVYLKVRY